MARTKKTSKRRKRLSRWLKGAIKWTSGSVALGAVVSLVVASFRWAESTDQFDLDSIRLSGNLYLGEEEILEWLELPTFATLDKMDLRAIQEKLESHPYVRAARASRDFPSALDITVVERIPIAYINRSPFYLVDEEGIILPVKNGSFEFDVPTLSGFNPSPELYPVGEKCLSQKVLEAVGYVAFINRVFPSLYNDLSEVRIDARDEYV
ncbi:MAG: cell division protein FtsQ/DivIB, partial [Fidelibacterota bacterium]